MRNRAILPSMGSGCRVKGLGFRVGALYYQI